MATPKPKTPQPKGSRNPKNGKAVIHFEILRRIAETASGMRYDNLWFEVTGGRGGKVIVHRAPPEKLPRGSVVIECNAWKRPGVPEVDHAQIGSGDRRMDLLNVPVPVEDRPQGWDGPLTHRADAVFWSAAAVEKFLVPYYASTYGDLAAKAVEQLLNVFVPPHSPEDRGNAMITAPDGSGSRLPTNLGTPDVGITSVPAADQPFAVVHLPSSEYVAEGLEDALPRLFTLHPSGAIKKLHAPVPVTAPGGANGRAGHA
jgi:hypothetical protein